jgi:Trypsin-co-occurring domain 1
MSYYIEFPTENGTILVEAEEVEVETLPGIEKAGLLSRKKDAGEAVAQARVSFDEAIKQVIGENVRALQEAVGNLAKAPDEVELTFGLKATGEAGNIAIGKLGGEANFQLRLLWTGSKQ